MATIKDIANMAGVSRGTVDRVINHRSGVKPETEEKVKKILKEVGYKPDITAKQLVARRKSYKFGMIVGVSKVSLFGQSVYEAAKSEAEELQKLGVKVEFFLLESYEKDFLSKLVKRVEESNIDALVVAPTSPRREIILNLLKRMEKKNIPIVFFNEDYEKINRLSYVGCDYFQAGRVAAGMIALCIEERGKIAVFTVNDDKIPSYTKRIEGFKAEINKKYPEMEIVNLKEDIVFTDTDYSSIARVMEKYTDLKAAYVINPGKGKVHEVIQNLASSKIKIITNDLLDIHKELLEKGKISGVICQEPEKQGSLPLKILYDYIVLEQKPEDRYLTELQIRISQNA